VFVLPALKVDTSLPLTTVTSIAGNTYETLSKNILKTRIEFFANFDKVGHRTTASSDMITQMNEQVKNMFKEDIDSTTTSAPIQAIPIMIPFLIQIPLVQYPLCCY